MSQKALVSPSKKPFSTLQTNRLFLHFLPEAYFGYKNCNTKRNTKFRSELYALLQGIIEPRWKEACELHKTCSSGTLSPNLVKSVSVLLQHNVQKRWTPKSIFSPSREPRPLSMYGLETTHTGRCDVEELGILDSMILCIFANKTKLRSLNVV